MATPSRRVLIGKTVIQVGHDDGRWIWIHFPIGCAILLLVVIFADRFLIFIRFLLGHLLTDFLASSINRQRCLIFVFGIGVTQFLLLSVLVHFFFLICTNTLILDRLELFHSETLIIIIMALAFTIRQQRLGITISLRRAVLIFTATDGEGISWDV